MLHFICSTHIFIVIYFIRMCMLVKLQQNHCQACRKFRPEKSVESRFWWLKRRFKSIKKALWLPYFKGSACKLDFPALHDSNFAAYFTGCQIFGPDKSFIVNF